MLSATRNIVVPFNTETEKYNFTEPTLVTDTYFVTNSSYVPPFSDLSGADLHRFVYELRELVLNFAYINVAAGSFGAHIALAFASFRLSF